MSHWYYKDGKPCTEVPKKSGGVKKPTIKEARELGLVPSVTTILKVIQNTGLEIWKTNQILEFAWKVKKEGNYLDWVEQVRELASTESELASDTGTDIHEAITNWLQGKPYLDYYEKWVDSFKGWWNAQEKDIVGCELYIPTTNGYGGRYDIILGDTLIDIKTQNSKGKPLKTYRSWGRQLAAYGDVLNCKKLLNWVVDSQKPDGYLVYEWEDKEKLLNEFNAAKTLWLSENNLEAK